jgi:hypothetical protein
MFQRVLTVGIILSAFVLGGAPALARESGEQPKHQRERKDDKGKDKKKDDKRSHNLAKAAKGGKGRGGKDDKPGHH